MRSSGGGSRFPLCEWIEGLDRSTYSVSASSNSDCVGLAGLDVEPESSCDARVLISKVDRLDLAVIDVSGV